VGFSFLIFLVISFHNHLFRFFIKICTMKSEGFFFTKSFIPNNVNYRILMNNMLMLLYCRKYIFNVYFQFHIFQGEALNIIFYEIVLFLLQWGFSYLSHGKFVGTFNYSRGRILISSSTRTIVDRLPNWVGH
jgi:hypothetical protein